MSSHVAHRPKLEMAVVVVILLNTVLLVWAQLDHVHEDLIEDIESSCLVFFVLELLVRIRDNGLRFFRRPWCVADTLIILLSLLPMLGVFDISVLRVARLSRLVHLGRHMSHLRLLRVFWVARLLALAHWRMTSGGAQITISGW